MISASLSTAPPPARKMDVGSGSNSQSSPTGAFNSEESASQPHAHRQKMDIAGGYVSEGRNAQERKTMTCTQCFKVFSEDGIHRIKQHLAGISGSVSSCPKVDPAVRIATLASLQENEKKSKERR